LVPLERAITRWARNNWADPSSTKSSASSDTLRSSFRTVNKSKSSRRKRRPPSLADLKQREQSERMVAARMRAREIARRAIPREFNFYCPPAYPPQVADLIEEEQQFVRAPSLDVILPHLDHVLRKPGKAHRPRQRGRRPRVKLDHPHQSHGHSAKNDEEEAHNLNAPRAGTLEVPSLTMAKGKDKVPTIRPLSYPQQTALTQRDPVAGKSPQAWWLDVASPSWEDMKTLGKVSSSPFLPLTAEPTWGAVATSSPSDP
jgi:magnesium transporter